MTYNVLMRTLNPSHSLCTVLFISHMLLYIHALVHELADDDVCQVNTVKWRRETGITCCSVPGRVSNEFSLTTTSISCHRNRSAASDGKCTAGKWRADLHGWRNNRTGRKAVWARQLFTRSCDFASPAVWSVIFQSCVISSSICCCCCTEATEPLRTTGLRPVQVPGWKNRSTPFHGRML